MFEHMRDAEVMLTAINLLKLKARFDVLNDGDIEIGKELIALLLFGARNALLKFDFDGSMRLVDEAAEIAVLLNLDNQSGELFDEAKSKWREWDEK